MKNPWMKKVEKNRQTPLDVMLYNQKTYNSVKQPVLSPQYRKKPKDWDKTSFEIVRTLDKSIAFQLVSIQPMSSPNDVIKYNKFSYDAVEYNKWIKKGCPDPSPICLAPQEDPIASRTRSRKTRWGLTVAEDLATEIFREIVTDLRNNAGTIAKYKWKQKDSASELFNKVQIVDNYIYKKTLIQPENKWAVMNPEMATIFDTGKYPSGLDVAGSLYHPHYAGILQNWLNVYIDPLFPKCQILLGWKTTGPCYTYCPYIPLVHLEDNKFASRYAKQLPREGAKSYGLIKVEDFEC